MQNPASITRAAGLTTKQAIALSAVFCSLSCLPCSGQVLKGSKPEVPPAPMTPAQLQERIRAAHSTSRTLSAVRNPYASQPDDAAIIVVLRSQKQAADRELQEIQALRRNAGNTHPATAATQSPGGQAGAQPNTSGNSPAAMPGTRVRAIRDQSASQTVSPAAANAGSLPQGPMGTRSASGGQPGSAPNPAIAAGPNSAIVGAVCPLPHIDTVSGQATGTLFTPQGALDVYTIKGCGFGDKPGNAYLRYGIGTIPLQVDHWYWTDTAFAVRVDPQLSGQLDHDDVRLVVEPVGAALIQKSGFKFRAARVTMTMPQVPQNSVQLFQPGRSSDSVIVMPTYFTPSQSPPGWTAEVQRGFYRTDFPAGSDSFDIGRLAPGFTATAQFTGSDNCGQFAVGESWNIKWDSGNAFRVIWTEWHCPVSGTPPFVAADYAVSVAVTGPRGVDPWTGRASASMIALPR